MHPPEPGPNAEAASSSPSRRAWASGILPVTVGSPPAPPPVRRQNHTKHHISSQDPQRPQGPIWQPPNRDQSLLSSRGACLCEPRGSLIPQPPPPHPTHPQESKIFHSLCCHGKGVLEAILLLGGGGGGGCCCCCCHGGRGPEGGGGGCPLGGGGGGGIMPIGGGGIIPAGRWKQK